VNNNEGMLNHLCFQLLGSANKLLCVRLLLQVVTAVLLAFILGFREARKETQNQSESRLAGFDIVFVITAVIDLLYQLFVNHRFYPLQAILFSTLFGILPFFLIRGVATSCITKFYRSNPKKGAL
jgi:hypothetical protein